jgi:hypothetical protein
MPKTIALVALIATVGLEACNGALRPTQTTDGSADGDGAATDGPTQEMPQDAILAANGAPIPPVDPSRNCDRLGLQLADTCPSGGYCPEIDCVCQTGLILTPTQTIVVFEGFPCNAGLPCVASVSCPAACDAGIDVVFECASDGLCTTDQECRAGQTCVPVPGQIHGACSGHGVGSPCFVDADCTSSACVASPAQGARRSCTDRTEGSVCNRDSHCAVGRCIFASADQFSGVCTLGSLGDPCVGPKDCKAVLQLDCAPNGKCLGANLAFCAVDSECASGMCASGHCTDGQLGHPCLTSAQCAPGLHCSPTPGFCTAPLPDGSDCATDGECMSGHCSPSPDAGASPSCAAM